MSGYIGDLNDALDNLPAQSYDLVPAGLYAATIQKVDLRPTKDGTGQRMNIQLGINGPTCAGRVVFAGLNIRNTNPKTEEIARRDLKSIRDSLGLARVNEVDELVGRSLLIKVICRPASDGYEASNDVRGYKPLDGAIVPPPAVPAAASVAPPKREAPWMKKPAAPSAVQEGEAKKPEPAQEEIF
jgi:hypothetical protein